MRLLSFFGLSCFFQLCSKGGKDLLRILLEIVFMTKIKIIPQPFHIILLRARLNTSGTNERDVLSEKLSRNLIHEDYQVSCYPVENE